MFNRARQARRVQSVHRVIEAVGIEVEITAAEPDRIGLHEAAGDGVTLIGGSGDDSFSGGPGSTLTGGEGSDTFFIRHTMFPTEAPPAVITDFNPETDRLNIQLERDRDDMDERVVTLRDSDQGLEIVIEGHVAVVLEGLTTEDEVVPQVF